MPCPYILKPYVKHGEQAERSNGGPIVCFDRPLARNPGYASRDGSFDATGLAAVGRQSGGWIICLLQPVDIDGICLVGLGEGLH